MNYILEWRNAENTILAKIDGNHTTIVEPNHPEWAALSNMQGIAQFPIAELTEAETLQLARDAAYIYRADFCTALMSLGILSHADAIEASRGGWPAAMAGFLVYLTEPQAAVAQIEWASAATIRRMNYLVLTLQSFLGLTDAQVDAIFGL